jgi:flagellar biosynthesis protein FliP
MSGAWGIHQGGKKKKKKKKTHKHTHKHTHTQMKMSVKELVVETEGSLSMKLLMLGISFVSVQSILKECERALGCHQFCAVTFKRGLKETQNF